MSGPDLPSRAPTEGTRSLERLGRRAWDHDGREIVELDLRVPEDLVFFRGHFEGSPVLPGVVQIGALALETALDEWPDLGGLRRARRLKFMRPIRPGSTLTVRLERVRDEPRVSFSVDRGQSRCTSGILLFDPRPRGAP